MKLFAAAAIAAATILLSSHVMAETRTIATGEFTTVDVASGIRAKVSIGPNFSVVAEAPQGDDFKALHVDTSDGVLRARFDDIDMLLGNPRSVTLTITLPSLAVIDASSGARVEAIGNGSDALLIDTSSGATAVVSGATASSYRLDASSGSNITIDGTCDRLDADSSSVASINARALDCRQASADASSGAHIDVAAAEAINADASSGGNITVFGNPDGKSYDQDSGGAVVFRDE